MRIIDRFIIFLLSLVVLLIGAGAILVSLDFQGSAVMLANNLGLLFVDYRWFMLIGGALLVVLAVVFIFASAFHSTKGGKVSLVNSSAQGENVQISVNAVDAIIGQVAKAYGAVSDVSTKISQNENGVHIKVKLTVDSNANIPNLAVDIQNAIKNQLENMVGLAVDNIQIMVSDVNPQPMEVGA